MLAVLLVLPTAGFVACSVTTSTSVQGFAARSSPVRAHWMDHLKFDGSTPTFDVLEKTKYAATKYAACKTAEEFLPLYADDLPLYADDYVFRGSIIGPISGEEVRDTQKGFSIPTAYPDLDRCVFGFTIDPENPYRCLFFERWTATNTGATTLGPLKLKPTGNRVETPLHVSSITWNPEGKIIYNSISPPVDRFEGNTKGAGAFFGLLVGAGVVSGPASVGLPTLMLQQKVVQKLGIFGKQWSDEADVPAWWKSKAVGADPNDL